ncbi:DNA-binding protein [Parashewanella curva]|uniref:DNA-binding protein n=1 Tax=Parashewanella curva TaxID=2338552 RepID=A0A3L8PQV6_9GAMM|nr:DNA-binding protein [Parashewanella curva]RLV57777.1 DNA-binding protein [Parashewanella curva]
MSNQQFYNYTQLANLLRMDKRTLINRVCRQKKFLANGLNIEDERVKVLAPPSIKLGREVLFRYTAVEQWLNQFEMK